jgi:hypothetical protein
MYLINLNDTKMFQHFFSDFIQFIKIYYEQLMAIYFLYLTKAYKKRMRNSGIKNR